MLHRNFVSRANAFLRGAMGATRIHARMCVMCKISDLHTAASLSPSLSLSLSLSLSSCRRSCARVCGTARVCAWPLCNCTNANRKHENKTRVVLSLWSEGRAGMSHRAATRHDATSCDATWRDGGSFRHPRDLKSEDLSYFTISVDSHVVTFLIN